MPFRKNPDQHLALVALEALSTTGFKMNRSLCIKLLDSKVNPQMMQPLTPRLWLFKQHKVWIFKIITKVNFNLQQSTQQQTNNTKIVGAFVKVGHQKRNYNLVVIWCGMPFNATKKWQKIDDALNTMFLTGLKGFGRKLKKTTKQTSNKIYNEQYLLNINHVLFI